MELSSSARPKGACFGEIKGLAGPRCIPLRGGRGPSLTIPAPHGVLPSCQVPQCFPAGEEKNRPHYACDDSRWGCRGRRVVLPGSTQRTNQRNFPRTSVAASANSAKLSQTACQFAK